MLLYKILASYCLLMKLCDFQAIEVLIQYVQAWLPSGKLTFMHTQSVECFRYLNFSLLESVLLLFYLLLVVIPYQFIEVFCTWPSWNWTRFSVWVVQVEFHPHGLCHFPEMTFKYSTFSLFNLHQSKARIISFHLVYLTAWFDEVDNLPRSPNFDLWPFKKVLVGTFSYFMWIL